jgi:hypothetical protein
MSRRFAGKWIARFSPHPPCNTSAWRATHATKRGSAAPLSRARHPADNRRRPPHRAPIVRRSHATLSGSPKTPSVNGARPKTAVGDGAAGRLSRLLTAAPRRKHRWSTARTPSLPLVNGACPSPPDRRVSTVRTPDALPLKACSYYHEFEIRWRAVSPTLHAFPSLQPSLPKSRHQVFFNNLLIVTGRPGRLHPFTFRSGVPTEKLPVRLIVTVIRLKPAASRGPADLCRFAGRKPRGGW